MRGAIVFFRDDGIFSRTIRFFQKGPLTHVAIVYEVGQDKIVMLDATGGRVQMASMGYTYGARKNLEMVGIMPLASGEALDKALREMLCYLDEPYGWWKIFGTAMCLKLYEWFGLEVKNPFQRGILCWELVRDYLVKLGYTEFEKWNDHRTTTWEFFKHITSDKVRFPIIKFDPSADARFRAKYLARYERIEKEREAKKAKSKKKNGE